MSEKSIHFDARPSSSGSEWNGLRPAQAGWLGRHQDASRRLTTPSPATPSWSWTRLPTGKVRGSGQNGRRSNARSPRPRPQPSGFHGCSSSASTKLESPAPVVGGRAQVLSRPAVWQLLHDNLDPNGKLHHYILPSTRSIFRLLWRSQGPMMTRCAPPRAKPVPREPLGLWGANAKDSRSLPRLRQRGDGSLGTILG